MKGSKFRLTLVQTEGPSNRIDTLYLGPEPIFKWNHSMSENDNIILLKKVIESTHNWDDTVVQDILSMYN